MDAESGEALFLVCWFVVIVVIVVVIVIIVVVIAVIVYCYATVSRLLVCWLFVDQQFLVCRFVG